MIAAAMMSFACAVACIGAPAQGKQFSYDPASAELTVATVGSAEAYEADVEAIGSDRLSHVWVEHDATMGAALMFAICDVANVVSQGTRIELPAGRLRRPTLTHTKAGTTYLIVEREDPVTRVWTLLLGRVDDDASVDEWRSVDDIPHNAVHHAASTIGDDDLAIVWQRLVQGQWDIAFRVFDGRDFRPVEAVAATSWNERAPDIAVTPDGQIFVVWDAFTGESHDVHGRVRVQGRWQTPKALASGPAFEARPTIAAAPDASKIFVAWEEGATGWGRPFRGKKIDWNNASDEAGPLHRFRAIRVVEVDSDNRNVTPRAFLMPSFEVAAARPTGAGAGARRPDAVKLGVYYESPRLAVDADGNPWLAYRHCYAAQVADVAPTEHHIEMGFKVYVVGLDRPHERHAFAQHQRDGMQRLEITGLTRGCAIAWHYGRTDRRDEAAGSRGVAIAVHAAADVADASVAALEPIVLPVVEAAVRPQKPAVRRRIAGRDLELVFGDLHRHTDISLCFPFFDGSLDDAYRYAQDVAELDFLGITDHARDLDRGNVGSQLWSRCVAEVTRNRLEPRFFPFFAHERSHGDTDHNVISLRDDVLASHEPPLEQYWKRLDASTITIPHNPIAGKVWKIRDDARRPLFEIYQGCRDEVIDEHAHVGLATGQHFGFIASSDHLSTCASFAGVWTTERSREGIFRSLQARRTFAATDKILVSLASDAHVMGERFDTAAPPRLHLNVEGTGPLASVAFVLDGKVVERRTLDAKSTTCDLDYQVQQLRPGEHWIYAAVAQVDGNRAWTSPLWFTLPADLPVFPFSEGASTSERSAADRDRPNIVLIVADDLGWSDLSCQGSKFYETPNIDGLASSGLRFTNAYANAPNCAPTRASLLTGLYTPRHGIYTVGSSKRGKARFRKLVPTENKTELGDDFVTLPEVLKTRGYRNGSFGKWHLGEDPRTQGFHVNVGGTTQGHPKSYTSPYSNKALPDGEDGEYLTDRLTDEACAFMARNKERPFFCYLSYFAVHTPIQPKEGSTKKFEEKVETKQAAAGQDNAKYAGMVATLDANVGRVLAKLKELEVDDNTIVIFVSDNGGLSRVTSNRPLRGGKGMLYEGGIRVPWIVRHPAIERRGETIDTPVITSDLFVTLAAMAGVEAAKIPKNDGVNLTPLLRGAAFEPRVLAWHFPAYLEDDVAAGTWRCTPASALRFGRHKLLHFFETGKLELYDLEADPGETTDIADKEPGLVVDLEALLAKWRLELDAPIPSEREPEYGKE